NCHNDFTIESEDFAFYDKIKVPPPTFCAECRLQRRLCIRNERSLYKRICELCKKEVISIYSLDKKVCVYCLECYKSDVWDPSSYGRDYDFNKPLFQQLDDLFRAVPRPERNETNAVDCSYCEDCTNCKNCYLVFGGYHCDDIMYSYTPLFSRKLVDVTMVNHSEMTYESSSSYGLYNTRFAHLTDECLDCSFMHDCRGCSDCFGGINLRSKKYHIFNKQYSKKEYAEEMKKWDIGSYATLRMAQQKFQGLYYATPRRYAVTTNVVNVTGNNIRNAKNCHQCFSVIEGAENLKFVYMAGLAFKDSYDAWGAGEKSQLLYEVTGCAGGERVFFTNNTHYCTDVQYSNKCFHCSNLFGCVGLRKKSYCIFNKQYTKEEYFKLLESIIDQSKQMLYIDERGRKYGYGEFFPIELMPFAYNETLAYEKFPLTREQALEERYPWQDEPERRYTITMGSEALPDHIDDVPESIVNEVISCQHNRSCGEKCTTAFRITPRELSFYKQIKVALPRLCPNCRHAEREKRRNSELQLWHGKCQCAGGSSENGVYENHGKHSHGAVHCGNEFETVYAPGRREIVYCEECYQQEAA
ncbi:MAG: hypothetical protein AAB858_03345, partial [Patescibacteria group bacterium]